MAGEIQLNSTSFASESGGTITINNATVGSAVAMSANQACVKTAINASGSAPIYACRAWVNFNGTETVAIRDSGNVSSITDYGAGDYTVNFTTAMPDGDYAPFISNSKSPDVNFIGINTNTTTGGDVAPSTTSCRISFSEFGVGGTDPTYISFAVFR